MLIDILNQDKKRIGLFIDYKRKQFLKNKGIHFQIEKYIEGICAKQTYNKIRKGIEVKESQLYDELLKALHYKYLYDDVIKNEINKKEQKLLYLLKKEDKALFYKQLNVFIKKIALFQMYALESILFECLMIIKEENLKNHDIHALLQMYPMLDDIAKEICGYFLLEQLYHFEADNFNYVMLESSGLLRLKTINNRWWIMNLLIRWELYYSASLYCESLLKDCQIEKNLAMEYRIKICRLFIIMAIEPNSFEKHIEEIETNALYKDDAENYDTFQFTHIVGLYYYSKKCYDNAWKYFIKSVYYETSYFPEILFLNHIATIQDKSLPNDLMKEGTVYDVEKEYQIIYQYFCMNYKGIDVQVLEDYLWQHCRRLVKETYPSWIMKDIISSEFNWIAQQTDNRKRLYQFNKLNEK